ncbi:aminomethyltransferase, mitochondrial isoform X4 [Haemaphysalis longicornis]
MAAAWFPLRATPCPCSTRAWASAPRTCTPACTPASSTSRTCCRAGCTAPTGCALPSRSSSRTSKVPPTLAARAWPLCCAVPATRAGLAEDCGTLTVYTNEQGGIIDDLIVNKTKDWLYIVSNAGCRDKDLAHVQAKLAAFQAAGGQATLELLDSWSLLALQGPAAAELLQPLVDCSLAQVAFMRGATVTLAGVPGCRLTRCGYTGEDGFELSVPSMEATGLAEELLSRSAGRLQLAGLGARDSLRLEAGLCLYGQDIDEQTTPVEAGLTFTIGKRRRQLADFPGAARILEQIRQKPRRRRVGLVATSAGPPARSGATVYDAEGSHELGRVTSGIPSPSLGSNIAMAYVPSEHSAAGTKVQLEVRGRRLEATVVKMPFVPSHYYTGQS